MVWVLFQNCGVGSVSERTQMLPVELGNQVSHFPLPGDLAKLGNLVSHFPFPGALPLRDSRL